MFRLQCVLIVASSYLVLCLGLFIGSKGVCSSRKLIEGNESISYDNIFYCCNGYKQQGIECIPVCTQECIQSACTGPEICSCKLGYVLDLKNKYVCNPVCTKPCIHGKCVQPDVCKCNRGYALDLSNHFKCNKMCMIRKFDRNGKGICSCEKGYELLENSTHCSPICTNKCVNGECSSPNFCTCNYGYLKNAKYKHLCDPICRTPCTNGVCSAPNSCKCNVGYVQRFRNRLRCDPVCSNPCKNGFCSMPDLCSCFTGFVPDQTDKYSCIPECQAVCKNGYCSAPNRCTCYPGYKSAFENRDTCEPICSPLCQYGNCTAPGVCTCMKDTLCKNNNNEILRESSSQTIEIFYSTKTYSTIIPTTFVSDINPTTVKYFQTSIIVQPNEINARESSDIFDDSPTTIDSEVTSSINHLSKENINTISTEILTTPQPNDISSNNQMETEFVSTITSIYKEQLEIEAETTTTIVEDDLMLEIKDEEIDTEMHTTAVNVDTTLKEYKNIVQGYHQIETCESSCTNGSCERNGTCTCNDGFRSSKSNNYSCEPICKGSMIYIKETNECQVKSACKEKCFNDVCNNRSCKSEDNFTRNNIETKMGEIDILRSEQWLKSGVTVAAISLLSFTVLIAYVLKKNWKTHRRALPLQETSHSIVANPVFIADGFLSHVSTPNTTIVNEFDKETVQKHTSWTYLGGNLV